MLLPLRTRQATKTGKISCGICSPSSTQHWPMLGSLKWQLLFLWWSHQLCPQPALEQTVEPQVEREKKKERSFRKNAYKQMEGTAVPLQSPPPPSSQSHQLEQPQHLAGLPASLSSAEFSYLLLTFQITSWFLWPFSWNLEKAESSASYQFLLVEGANQLDPGDLQILFQFQLLENKALSRLTSAGLYRHTPELWDDSC